MKRSYFAELFAEVLHEYNQHHVNVSTLMGRNDAVNLDSIELLAK